MIHSLFTFKTFRLCFGFYRQFLIFGLLVTGLILVLKMNLFFGLMMKLVLFATLFAAYFETGRRNKLIFYKNFGISPIVLFLFSYFIDAVLTLIPILIFKAFW